MTRQHDIHQSTESCSYFLIMKILAYLDYLTILWLRKHWLWCCSFYGNKSQHDIVTKFINTKCDVSTATKANMIDIPVFTKFVNNEYYAEVSMATKANMTYNKIYLSANREERRKSHHQQKQKAIYKQQ